MSSSRLWLLTVLGMVLLQGGCCWVCDRWRAHHPPVPASYPPPGYYVPAPAAPACPPGCQPVYSAPACPPGCQPVYSAPACPPGCQPVSAAPVPPVPPPAGWHKTGLIRTGACGCTL